MTNVKCTIVHYFKTIIYPNNEIFGTCYENNVLLTSESKIAKWTLLGSSIFGEQPKEKRGMKNRSTPYNFS